jgi:hypothetical protein
MGISRLSTCSKGRKYFHLESMSCPSASALYNQQVLIPIFSAGALPAEHCGSVQHVPPSQTMLSIKPFTNEPFNKRDLFGAKKALLNSTKNK